MSAPAHFDTPFPSEPFLCGEWPVEEAWIDYNGHMNVGYYGVAFDRGFDVLFDDWLDFGAGYVSREGMGPFAMQAHYHYLNELKVGETFRVRVQLLDCDAKRIHYFATMERATDDAVAATCEGVSINVDLTARRSTELPERQQARLRELMTAHRELPRPELVGRALGIRRRG